MTPEATETLTRLTQAENFRSWDLGRMAEVEGRAERMNRILPADLALIAAVTAGEGQNTPWTGEPDKVQWIDPATGLDCLIVRNQFGALCGYVGVPPGHRFYGIGYNTCPQECGKDDCEHSPESVLRVHGGITFSNVCDPAEGDDTICHVPTPGRPDAVYWFGFDTAHFQDLVPGMGEMAEMLPGMVYRDMAYVVTEIEHLARQLADS